jgi:hypothetical protein
VLDELREVLGVLRRHVVLRDLLAERLVADRVEQEPRGDEAVRGILLDQRARGEHDALAHLVHRHAVVEVLERRLEDPLGIDLGEPSARFPDELGQPAEIERPRDALVDDDDLGRRGLAGFRRLLRTLLRAALAVEHVRARDLVLAAAHQRQLDLVLDLLDVDRAALGLALHQRGDHAVGERRHLLAHARGGGALAAVDGEERLRHRDGDLRRLEGNHRAVAADHLVLREPGIGGLHHASALAGGRSGRRGRLAGGSAGDLHGFLSPVEIVFLCPASGRHRPEAGRFTSKHGRKRRSWIVARASSRSAARPRRCGGPLPQKR